MVGPYQREQEVSATPHDRKTAAKALTGLAAGGDSTGNLVFPSPTYKPHSKSWWRRWREANTAVVEEFETHGDYAPMRRWTYRDINPEGEGTVYSHETMKRVRGNWPKDECETQTVGPNQTIDSPLFLEGKDYSNTNMPGLTAAWDVGDVNWSGSNLQGATFSRGNRYILLQSVNFDGADLANARFQDAVMSNISMRGANLAGVSFDNVRQDGSYDVDYFVDVTDSNVTAEQFDALRKAVSSGDMIRINRYTLDEVAGLTGQGPDAIAVSLWAGDIVPRSYGTDQPVDANEPFDTEKHYIPQWEVQKLLGTGSQ
jgi:hypothetical protein